MVITLRATLGLKAHLNSNNSFLMIPQTNTMIHRLAIKGHPQVIKAGISSTGAKSAWIIKGDTRNLISKIIWTAVPLATRMSNISSTRRISAKAVATCSMGRWREINITIDNKDSSTLQATRATRKTKCMGNLLIKEGTTSKGHITITMASNKTITEGAAKGTWRTTPINTTRIMVNNKDVKALETTEAVKWAGTRRITTDISTMRLFHRMSTWILIRRKILTHSNNIRLKKKTLNHTLPKIKNQKNPSIDRFTLMVKLKNRKTSHKGCSMF